VKPFHTTLKELNGFDIASASYMNEPDIGAMPLVVEKLRV